jgi:regulator of sigma E protease
MQHILDLLNHLWPFLFVLLTIVFVHELGHYIVAKLCGVKVEVFSVGFGREIFGWNDKSGTRWKICLLPLGGYIKMHGDNFMEAQEPKDPQAFTSKSFFPKSAIVLAGPAMNFLLATCIITILYWNQGDFVSPPIIGQVETGSVAEAAGIEPGDIVLAIEERTITNFADIATALSAYPNQELQFSLQRGDLILNKTLQPKLIKTEEHPAIYRIGIRSTAPIKINYSFIESLSKASDTTLHVTAETAKALKQMVLGQRNLKELSGPIGIATYSNQASKLGLANLLWLMAILSINLGLMNLLPIPVLDGGHFMFYLIEAIIGKKIAVIFYKIGMNIGILLILTLMITSTFNDLRKII